MFKKYIGAGILALFGHAAMAQSVESGTEAAPMPDESDAIAIYGVATPGETSSEFWFSIPGIGQSVRNVTRPTLTPILPDPADANGAAVIVAPGGAFMMLAWEREGLRVAQALADRGIVAFVLKYRLVPTPTDEAEAGRFVGQRMAEGMADPTRQPPMPSPEPTEDALAALALVRARAEEWQIDPERVGMIGFSAGAMTTLQAVLVEDVAQRPDFFGYIYGPQPAVVVPADAPPMFAAIAFDDAIFNTQGFPIVEAWHLAGRPVELHAYGRGGHGFGAGASGTTTTLVLEQFTAWMAMQGLMAANVGH